MEEILALRIFKTIVGIVGILGNGLVCLVIIEVPSMQTRTNAFIFHQAVMDFLGSTVILLQSEVPLPDPIPNDSLGRFICSVWFSNFVLFLLLVISTFNLLSLSMERYFAIVYPFKYQAIFTNFPRFKVGVIIAACWIFGLVVKSYNLFIFTVKDGKCVSSAVSRSQVVGILTAILQYVVPVAVMLFAYIRISIELKRSAARVGPAPVPAPAPAPVPVQGTAVGSSNADTAPAADMMGSLLRARRNTFKMLWIVFITFVVCWTPNQVIFLMFNIGFLKLQYNEWYYLLSVAMVVVNCCVNPVIYAFKYRQFRKGLRQLLFGRRSRTEHISDTGSHTNTMQ